MAEHRLEATDETFVVGIIERDRPPVLTIESGDVVDLETASHFGDKITPSITLDDVIGFRKALPPGTGPHTLTGPIEIHGATAGQVLKVEIGHMVPRDHGFNMFYPGVFGNGLLPDIFPDGELRHFKHDLVTMRTEFASNVVIPLRPFLGIMAVAPEDGDKHTSIPPDSFGGNMDLAMLTEGSTLYLPVFADGAMFRAGDAHSRQGNGEVCLTAIETAMRHAHLRFSVLDEPSIERPYAENAQHWITLAFHPDLLEASRLALQDMIVLLQRKYGLKRGEAYSLCSLVGDLSITQVVNGTRGVHITVEKSLFTSLR